MSEEIPVSGGFGCTVQGFEDESVYGLIKEQGRTTCAGQEATSPGYFETMGVPVLHGRTFTDQDNDDPSRGAVVVSKAFAERFWPGRDALGQGVGPNGNTDGPFYHVVGVVDDVARSSAEGEPPLSQPAVAIYYPVRHDPAATWNRNWWPGYITLVVKSDLADPSSLFPAIRAAVADVDPEIPLANLTDMEAVVAGAMSELSFVSLLLGIAAGTALLLAAVGLYGVLSYVVTRRTREIGMRLAVGAKPGEVQGMVVRGAMTLVAGGLILGLALAAGATRIMQGLLVGVEPTDPVVFALAAGLLTLVALAASWIPARRASRIDPLEALRTE
jgi:predicted permease